MRFFSLFFLLVACSKDVEPPKMSVVATAPTPATPVAAPKPAPKERSWKDAYRSVEAITAENVEDFREAMETPTTDYVDECDMNPEREEALWKATGKDPCVIENPPAIKKGEKITVEMVVDYLRTEVSNEPCFASDPDGCNKTGMIEKDGVWYYVLRKLN